MPAVVKDIEEPRNVRVCRDLIQGVKNQKLRVVRMPTKVPRINIRKTPCGKGFKTWNRFLISLQKRIIDLLSPSEIMKKITSINMEAGVEVEVTIAN